MNAKYLFFILTTLFIIGIFTTNLSCEPEFLVNTNTDNDQYYPDVALDSEGNFIISWMGSEPGELVKNIYAQSFDNDGNPIGDEFLVNTNTENKQSIPSIAMNPNGDFIIAWTSKEQDGSKEGVFAQRFDSDSNPVAGEFQVNVYTENLQSGPSIAINSDGEFIITWMSEGQDGELAGIYAKLYNNSGEIIIDEFLVNTCTEKEQIFPSVTIDNNGNFIITWTSYDQDGDGYGVYAKMFDRNGNITKEEFQVNSYIESWQSTSNILMNSEGDFIITWQSWEQDGDDYGIYAKIYDNTGDVKKEEFLVNTFTEESQTSPVIGIDNEGNFVITWESGEQNGIYGIFAQKFDCTGEPLGREFQVNVSSCQYQTHPSIDMNGNGDYVIAFDSYNNFSAESGFDIYARMFNMENTPPADIIPPVVEITYPTSEDIVYGTIDILIKAYDQTGIQSVEVQINDGEWNECHILRDYWTYSIDVSSYIGTMFEIKARATDASDNANIGHSQTVSPTVISPDDFDEFRVNTTTLGTQENPAVAMNQSGDFVITWQGVNGIFARKYADNGSLLQADEFQVNTEDSGSNPSAAMDAEGNFVVVWEGQNILAKIYDNQGNLLIDEFEVGSGSNPVVAMNRTGDFVIAWDITKQEEDIVFQEINARRYDSEGNPLSEAFAVFPDTNSLEQSVAIHDDGSFVIIGIFLQEDGLDSDIHGRLYDSSGNPHIEVFKANTHDKDWKTVPSVAMDADGNFIVTWQSVAQDGSGTGIYAQRFDYDGNFVGNEFQVNSVHWENQTSPCVAIDANGNFVVTWDNWYMGGEKRNVFARVFDNNAEPIDEFQVNSDTLASNAAPMPVLAIDADGDYVVAWQTLGDIYAKRIEFSVPDTTPPRVEIISPEDGSWVSGVVPFQITAYDESIIRNVEIKFDDANWQPCLWSDGYWWSDFNTDGLLDGYLVNVQARASDMSENANIGYSTKQAFLIKVPKVNLYYEGALSQPGDVLDIKVNVMNTRLAGMDLYVACQIQDNIYWYPTWSVAPKPTGIERGLWDFTVLRIPYPFRPIGTFKFFAGIVDRGNIQIVDLDSMEIFIE